MEKSALRMLIFMTLALGCASGRPSEPPEQPPPPLACVTAADCQTNSCNAQECIDGVCVDHWRDADQDGFADMMCGSGPEFSDCNDQNKNISPKEFDVCDCEDNDCDGVKDNLCNFQTKLLYPGEEATPSKGGVFGCYSDMAFKKIPHPSNETCENTTTPSPNTIFMNEVDEGVLPAIWYYGCDGKKYLFSHLGAFESWFGKMPARCCLVRVITDEIFQTIPRGVMAGGKICYRPGNHILQTTLTDGTLWDTLFVVAKGCVLRQLANEQVAEEIFGSDWKNYIENIPWAHYYNYFAGPLVKSKTDYDPMKEADSAFTIDQNQNL